MSKPANHHRVTAGNPRRCPRCRTGRLVQDIDGPMCLNCGHVAAEPTDGGEGTEWQKLVDRVQLTYGIKNL